MRMWGEVRARAEDVDERLRDMPHLYRVKHLLDGVMPAVLLVLITVLYLEFFATLTHAQHEIVILIEQLIFGYFVAELLVDFIIYEERRSFFRDRWIDIVLILPFLTLFRSFAFAGRALAGMKLFKPAKSLKTTKVAKAAKPVKAAKTTKTAKPVKAVKAAEAPTSIKAVKGSQKLGKLVKKAKHLFGGD